MEDQEKINDPGAYVQRQLNELHARWLNVLNILLVDDPVWAEALQNRLFLAPQHPAQRPLSIYGVNIPVVWQVLNPLHNRLRISPFYELWRIRDQNYLHLFRLYYRVIVNGYLQMPQPLRDVHGEPRLHPCILNSVIYVLDPPTVGALNYFHTSRVRIVAFIDEQIVNLENLTVFMDESETIDENIAEHLTGVCHALQGHYQMLIDDMAATHSRPEDVRVVLDSAVVIEPMMIEPFNLGHHPEWEQYDIDQAAAAAAAAAEEEEDPE